MTDTITTIPEALEAAARDEFDELAYRFWSIHPKDVTEPVGMPERYPGGARTWMYANEMRALADRIAAPVAVVAVRVQHIKRGSTYRVLGRGKVQTDAPLTDYAEVVVYQGEADGLVWVRPTSEFDDGRFAELPALTIQPPAQVQAEAVAKVTAERDELQRVVDEAGKKILHLIQREREAVAGAFAEAAEEVRKLTDVPRHILWNDSYKAGCTDAQAAILALIKEPTHG